MITNYGFLTSDIIKSLIYFCFLYFFVDDSSFKKTAIATATRVVFGIGVGILIYQAARHGIIAQTPIAYGVLLFARIGMWSATFNLFYKYKQNKVRYIAAATALSTIVDIPVLFGWYFWNGFIC